MRLVLHADDVGMCHGANQAFVELSAAGTIGAGSVMVPCPWFPEIAEIVAAGTGDAPLDVGVHLTLNSEQEHYRWGPLTRPSAASGLIDDAGYFWRSVADVRFHAHPDAVEAEWRAQIERALSVGIDVTHLDAHMGSSLAPEWCDRYIRLGTEYGVPVLITATLDAYGPRGHLADVSDADFAPFVDAARAANMPIFDRVLETDFARPPGARNDVPAMLASAADLDIVYAALHPCRQGEIAAIEPGAHHVRVDEYELFIEPSWRERLDASEFELMGMRELRAAFRQVGGAETSVGSVRPAAG